MSKSTFSLPRSGSALALCAALALPGCQQASAPPAEPDPTPPVLQAGQLHYASNHPQLALLAVTEARPASVLRVELPARLVWNEERTQRIVPAFAGRVAAIRADLGQRVQAGTTLALLASPDFGQAQADAAKAQADQHLAQQALARQRELFTAGIVARKELEQAEADAARAHAAVWRRHRREPAARAAQRHRRRGGGAQPQPRPGAAARPGRPGAVRGDRPTLAVGAD